jgi:hypothetical protein
VKLQKLEKLPPDRTGLRDGEKAEERFKILEDRKPIYTFLGKVPVMVRSKFCHLKTLEDHEIVRNAKECLYD